jgi:NDP-sugar pyrophosphorylase family protein
VPTIRSALILTAGLGTRLRPLTDVRAKAAIPVAGEPIVRRIARWIAGHGITDLVLNLHHRPETIARVMGDGSDLGVRVRYSWEQPIVLGSAGGPRQALPIVGAGTFVIVNGDTLTDVDLGALVRAHEASAALVTLALVPNREFDRYGGVLVDDHQVVTGFVPRGPAAKGSFHYIGVQVVSATAFESVRPGQVARSIGGVYDELMSARPGAVRAFVSAADFRDIGTVADYWNTSRALAASAPADSASPGLQVDPAARVTDSIAWDDVHVDGGAVVEECILTDGVRIPRGAVYRRAVIVQPAASGELTAVPLDV